MIGPKTLSSQLLHEEKYRGEGESFDDYCVRYARATCDGEDHFRRLLDMLREQRLLPAGRQQLAVGRLEDITAHNCFVGGIIEDSSAGIFNELRDSMLTLRTGGGCGWDFSTIRPSGDPIRGLGIKAYATGPVSFMACWDAMCKTVLSAGHRRGAMMSVLRVDHPDISTFINAKQDQKTLSAFNISVAITDDFMDALENNGSYDLVFNDKKYGIRRAGDIWSKIMERNWDWAEPGVLFIDRINQMNPLGYCEKIYATNPCGEQPLPPYGACLLGSINVVKYIEKNTGSRPGSSYYINFSSIQRDIEDAVRAFDNVIGISNYPLLPQRVEQNDKRRMGLGVTGMANALEVMGLEYGHPEYIKQQEKVLSLLCRSAYMASTELAKEKGVFPLFDADKWLSSGFAQTLPSNMRDKIANDGLRNGLLLSIAPTGTISLCADNVSSGIEPPYLLKTTRKIHWSTGQEDTEVEDYALREFGVAGKTAYEASAQDHIRVLCSAQKFIDSAVSKTCNLAGIKKGKKGNVSFDEFKELYMSAWRGGAKGCTTFNVNGERFGIFGSEEHSEDPEACHMDLGTGVRTCDE